MNRIYRGIYAGLTVTTIAALMNCSRPTARLYLRELSARRVGAENVSLADIGQLVARYHDLADTLLIMNWKFTQRQRMALILPGGMIHGATTDPHMWDLPERVQVAR